MLLLVFVFVVVIITFSPRRYYLFLLFCVGFCFFSRFPVGDI